MKLGFQQKDPASDLRGAGIAGVRHLTCFLRSHDAECAAATLTLTLTLTLTPTLTRTRTRTLTLTLTLP